MFVLTVSRLSERRTMDIDEKAKHMNSLKWKNRIESVISNETVLKRGYGCHRFGQCPICNKGVIFVDQCKQTYTCVSCGVTGDVFAFVQNFRKCSFDDAMKFLEQRGGR